MKKEAGNSSQLAVAAALLAASLWAGQARGEIMTLAAYGFSGTEMARLDPSEVAPGVSAQPIIVSGHVFNDSSSHIAEQYRLSSSGGNPGGQMLVYFQHTSDANNNKTEDGAALGNYFFDIVLSPDGSEALRLHSLGLDAAATNATNNRTFFVRYNHTGEDPENAFAAPSLLTGVIPSTSWSSFEASGNLIGLPDIMPGESLTLRFFQYRNIAGDVTTAQNIQYDNIRITGMLIPEPSSAVLMILALAGLVAVRRRSPPTLCGTRGRS